jgi:hypothetical protein
VRANESIERLVWNKTPLSIAIQVGTERRIEFPEFVEIHLPLSLQQRSKITLLGDGVLYWRATHAFPSTRIEAVTASGYHYLLDVLTTEAPTAAHPIKILDQRYQTADYSHTDITPLAGVPFNGYSEIALQRLLAHKVLRAVPRRLAIQLPGVMTIPLAQSPIPLYTSRELIAEPLLQVKAPHPRPFYVTAVQLRNRMSYAVTFDALRIAGHFTAASPLRENTVLAAKGHANDSLIVLLVSDRSFNESFQGSL